MPTPWRPDRTDFPRPVVRAILAAHPTCQACGSRPSTIADHIIPGAEGGTNDISNGQGLCTDCHDEKTRAEQARGLARRSLHRPRPPHPGML